MKNHEETYKDMKGNISLGHRKFLTRIKLKFVKGFLDVGFSKAACNCPRRPGAAHCNLRERKLNLAAMQFNTDTMHYKFHIMKYIIMQSMYVICNAI